MTDKKQHAEQPPSRIYPALYPEELNKEKKETPQLTEDDLELDPDPEESDPPAVEPAPPGEGP